MIFEIMGDGGFGSKKKDTDYITGRTNSDATLLLAMDLPDSDEEKIRRMGNTITTDFEESSIHTLEQLYGYIDLIREEVRDASVTVAIVGDELKIANCGNNILYSIQDGKISCVPINVEAGIPQVKVFPNEMSEGDALLLVTDGFASMIKEQEILLDYLKSKTAQDWFSYMMTRIGLRLNEESDCYSAIAVIHI